MRSISAGVLVALSSTTAAADPAPPAPAAAPPPAPAVGATAPAPPERDLTALSMKSQNPVSDLISVPVQLNFDSGGGLEDRSAMVVNIQPVVPVETPYGYTVVSRTILPLVNMPAPDEMRSTGLGDLREELFVTPSAQGALVWGAGPVLSLPIATADAVSTGTWGFGPGAVIVYTIDRWVLGGVAAQYWPLADAGGDRELNQLVVQPFANYNLAGGWAVVSAPIITADWEADEELTLPLGAGLSKTHRLLGQEVSGNLHYYYNVVAPDSGPVNQLRVTVSLLFPE